MKATRAWLLVVVMGVLACGDDGGKPTIDAGPGIDARLEGFDEPDDVCPGAAHCASAGDGQLAVGAAARVFTPNITETWTDENGNGEYDSERALRRRQRQRTSSTRSGCSAAAAPPTA
jgi:hypothetical protein